jgi:hypothetical protein
MKRHALILVVVLFAVSPANSASAQQRRKQDTWYERALRQINPDDTDYGSILEQHKRGFIDQLRNPYVRYSFAATVAIVMLLLTVFAQYVSHHRAMGIAVQSIADIRRHDEYARQTAREAIRRYNEHIESCNRVIEASESGLWKWISTAELSAMNRDMQQLNDELKAAREEVKRLNAELATKSATMADMSLRMKGASEEVTKPSKHSIPAPHVERINQLELELNLEKKKNQRLKGTALDVRNS